MAAPPTNYWDPRTSCHRDVLRIARVGKDYREEDVVWHAWLQLLFIYFPPYATNGRLYGVRKEAYRGEIGPTTSAPGRRANVIVVQMAPVPTPAANPQGLPDPNVSDPTRDILWVHCKAPCEDTPGGWKELMEQAGTQVNAAHPNRMLYVILAIGLKWMFFKWDPLTTPGAPLQVRAHHHDDVTWTLRPQYQYEPAVAGQSLGQMDIVDTSLALFARLLHPRTPNPIRAATPERLCNAASGKVSASCPEHQFPWR
ncbi:uncharacterized protein B0H64DRAFT_398438 [Chaetomium fimeti]|uniref:Uncharacterized protein n=1 Tax=Chaetomium fimeti TaxID=1854472 RepID=A0AAE0HJ04_9PEZI|nr:hypothetical protein B0H64DRAFT_398438 [Chaetomium fimeti]